MPPVEKMEKSPLPEDMIFEILARAPAESLVRFKCVSKTWHALIANPNFVEKHLRNTAAQISSKKLLIRTVGTDRKKPKNLISIHSPNPQTPNTTTMASDVVLFTPFVNFEIVGSSNGLVCIRVESANVLGNQKIEEGLYLYNPAIKGLMKLPTFRDVIPYWSPFVVFGFDPSTRSHKVVMFQNICVGQYSVVGVYVHKEDDTDDGWRLNKDAKLGRAILIFTERNDPVVLNGVIHLKAVRAEDGCNSFIKSIVCFDLGKEVFDVVDVPDLREHAEFVYWSVAILGAGSLGVIFLYEKGDADVWLMNKGGGGGGGVKQTWTKIYSAQAFPERIDYTLQRVFGGANGEVIVLGYEKETNIYAFDMLSGSFRRVLGLKQNEATYISSLHSYIETLVPLISNVK